MSPRHGFWAPYLGRCWVWGGGDSLAIATCRHLPKSAHFFLLLCLGVCVCVCVCVCESEWDRGFSLIRVTRNCNLRAAHAHILCARLSLAFLCRSADIKWYFLVKEEKHNFFLFFMLYSHFSAIQELLAEVSLNFTVVIVDFLTFYVVISHFLFFGGILLLCTKHLTGNINIHWLKH